MRVKGDLGQEEEGGVQQYRDLKRRDQGVWVEQIGQDGEGEIAASKVTTKSNLGSTSAKQKSREEHQIEH